MFEEYIFVVVFGLLSWTSSLQFAKLYPHNVKYGKYVLYLHSLLCILGIYQVFVSCYGPTQLHSIQNNNNTNNRNTNILLIFAIPCHFELFITNFILFQWIKIYFSVGVTEGWLIYYKWIMVFLSILSFIGLLISFTIITTFDKYSNLINIIYNTLMYTVGSYCILMSISFISVAYLLMRRVLKTSNLAGLTTDSAVCRRLLGSGVCISFAYFVQGTILICMDSGSIFISSVRWIAIIFKLCIIMIIVNTLLLYSKIIRQRLMNHWRKWAKSNRIWDLNTSSKKRRKNKRMHIRGDTEEIPFDPADLQLIRALSTGTNLHTNIFSHVSSIDNMSNIDNISILNTNMNRKVTQRYDKPILPMRSSTGWNSINNLNDILTDNENNDEEKQNINENKEKNEEQIIGFDTMDKLFDKFVLDSDDESDDMIDDIDMNDEEEPHKCDIMTEDEDETHYISNEKALSDIKAEAILVDIFENGLNSPSQQISNNNSNKFHFPINNTPEFDEHDVLVGDQFTDTIAQSEQINSSGSDSEHETTPIDYRKTKEYKNIFNDNDIINGCSSNPRFWKYLRKKHSKQINQKALNKFTFSFEKARYEPLLSREYSSITPCTSPTYFNESFTNKLTHFRSASDKIVNVKKKELLSVTMRNEYNKLNKKRKNLEQISNRRELDISGVAAKLDYWKANQLKHNSKWRNIGRAIKTARVENKHKLQAKEELNLITFNSDPLKSITPKWINMYAQHQTLQVQQSPYLGGFNSIEMNNSDSTQSSSDATQSTTSSSSSGKYSNSNDNGNTLYDSKSKYKKSKHKTVKPKKRNKRSVIFSVASNDTLNAIRYDKPPIFGTDATDSDDTNNETKSNLGTSSLKSFRKLKAISTVSTGKYMRAKSFTPRTPKTPITEENKKKMTKKLTQSDENVDLNESE